MRDDEGLALLLFQFDQILRRGVRLWLESTRVREDEVRSKMGTTGIMVTASGGVWSSTSRERRSSWLSAASRERAETARAAGEEKKV